MASSFAAGAATHQGGRHHNEDAMLLGDGLFAVADGLGGLVGGEIASRLALERLNAVFTVEQSVSGLLRACREANAAVWSEGDEEGKMGTTLVAVATGTDTGVVVAHVGDSRLYRLRQGRLEQLTQDHTVVAELLRDGTISAEEAAVHPHRSTLTRAIGVAAEIDVDYSGVTCKPGDRLMLATDGLFKTLSGERMKAILVAQAGAQDAADELVAAAVREESDDNVTAVVINVE